MQKGMIVIGLAATLFLMGRPAVAQEKGDMPEPGQHARNLENHRKQLELDQLKAEFGFQNEMREIQLEQKRLELEHQRQVMQGQGPKPFQCKQQCGQNWQGHHSKMKHCMGFVFLCFIVHLLLSVWVYQDIRRRNMGSGIWIVITLLTGFFGALVYAVVRLGDAKSA